jgi:uncharacterized membrane protein required for colicin V production
MGFIDLLLVAIIGFSMAWGWRKGLAAMIVRLVAIVASFFLVGHLFPLARASLVNNFGFSRGLATFVTVVLILVLIAVLVRIAIEILNRALKAVKLSGVNKFFGMLVGLVNALFFILIVMVVLDYFPKVSNSFKDPRRHKVYYALNNLKRDIASNPELRERMPKIDLKDILDGKKEGRK